MRTLLETTSALLLVLFQFSLPATAAGSEPASPGHCRTWLQNAPQEIETEEFRAQLRSTDASNTALTRMYDLFWPTLRTIYETKHGLSRTDAEDLASRTLLTAIEKRHLLADAPNPIGFVFKIGKYKLLDHYRAAGQRPLLFSQLETTELREASTPSRASSVAIELLRNRCLGLVKLVFEQNLSAPERACFAISTLYPEMSLAEQAEISGVSAQSHSTIASNGRGKIRRFLEGEEGCIDALSDKAEALREYVASWVPTH